MKCSIMQPTVLPWLGYFSLIESSDKFVFLDDVNFQKQSWQSRNKILTNHSTELMLPISVVRPSGLQTLVNEVLIDERIHWKKKQLKTFYFNYKSTKYFDQVYDLLEKHYGANYSRLSDFNINSIKAISELIKIDSPEFYLSSEMELPGDSTQKTDRLLAICNTLKCDTYLSPLGSKDYIDNEGGSSIFSQSGIEIFYNVFNVEPYPQFGKEPFVSNLSIMDALFHIGPENVKEMIVKGRDFKSEKDVS